jgi:hypothetical protein
MSQFPQWPRVMMKADGTKGGFVSPEAVPAGEGWMTVDQFRALDRDGDGKMGGSKAQAKPGELTDAEINADLEAVGVEPDPTLHKSTRLKVRNEARAAR